MLNQDFSIIYSYARESFLLEAYDFPSLIKGITFIHEKGYRLSDPDNSVRVSGQYSVPISGLPKHLKTEPTIFAEMLVDVEELLSGGDEGSNEENDSETKEEESGSEEMAAGESPEGSGEGIDFDFWRGLEDTKENKDQLVEDALKAGIEIKKGNKKLGTLITEFEKAYKEK